jgi:5-methylcytosine-specific restriction endonuclease McrA
MNYKGTKDKTYICQHCNTQFNFKGYSSTHKFCSLPCSYAYRVVNKDVLIARRYLDWLAGKELGVANPRKLIRGFLIKRDGYKCSCCGIDKWNGKDITLWTDHIDGNATNNHPSNFRLICPNCDSQSDTFGAKNYGKGRKARGLPQYG